jgi:hypothetical protein
MSIAFHLGQFFSQETTYPLIRQKASAVSFTLKQSLTFLCSLGMRIGNSAAKAILRIGLE